MSAAHREFSGKLLHLRVRHSSLSGVKGELLPSRTRSLLLESSFNSLFIVAIIAIIANDVKKSVAVSQRRRIKVLRYCPT